MKSLTFFSNKGGVGKTTLTCNFAYYLASTKNLNILVVDGDPQCNTTQLILGEERCNELYWPKGSVEGRNTLASIVQPLMEGEISLTENLSPLPASDNRFGVDLIPGDPKMSIIEDMLGKWWSESTGGDLGAVRKTNWVSMLQKEYSEYDLIIFDVGPSLGSLNRSILLATDYFVAPLAADTFSIVALRNIASWFGQWSSDYSYKIAAVQRSFPDRMSSLPVQIDLNEKFRFAGYTVQQYITRSKRGQRRPTGAYEALLNRIPAEVDETIAKLKPPHLPASDLRLGDVPNLYSLIPLAQDVNSPIAGLTSRDGITGGQYPQQREYASLMDQLGADLARNLGLDEYGEAAGERNG